MHTSREQTFSGYTKICHFTLIFSLTKKILKRKVWQHRWPTA